MNAGLSCAHTQFVFSEYAGQDFYNLTKFDISPINDSFTNTILHSLVSHLFISHNSLCTD